MPPASCTRRADPASFGYGPDQTRFWDLHAELDTDHGAWAFEALATETQDVEAIKAAAR